MKSANRNRTPRQRLIYSMTRRDVLRNHKLCVNGASHGRATHGIRCDHCHDVHRGASPSEVRPIARHPDLPSIVPMSEIATYAWRLADIREEHIALGEITANSKTAQDGA